MRETLLARRTTHGATALRGGPTWRPTPYQLFGFLAWLLLTLAHWRLPLCCDAGQHAAVVERLKANLLDPRHPTVDAPGEGSQYYTPYTAAQALLARLTGLGGWEVLRLAGPLNLLVLLTGLGRAVRLLTPRPWVPVAVLAVVTAALVPTAQTLAYPSTFAIGLTFWAWGWTGARGPVRFVGPSGRRSLLEYLALGAVYGLIVLIDPRTGMGAAVGALALISGRVGLPQGRGAVSVRGSAAGRDRLSPARRLITALTAALLLASAFEHPHSWPPYDWAARHIRPGEVVLTDDARAAHSIPGYGANLVAPAKRDASLREDERRGRRDDVRAYLSPEATREERTAIVHRHHVRWLLLTRRHRIPEEAVVVAWSERTGEVLARVPGTTTR
ncbi:hypothetical protein [Streptomyces sp. NPDC003635]